jgi:hypothetical protein
MGRLPLHLLCCGKVMLGDAGRRMYPRGHTDNTNRLRTGIGDPTSTFTEFSQTHHGEYVLLRLMQHHDSVHWIGMDRKDYSNAKILGDSTVVLPISRWMTV